MQLLFQTGSQPVQMVGDTDGVGWHVVREIALELKPGCLSPADSTMALAREQMVMVTSRKRSAETIFAGNECNEMNAGVKRLQVQQVRWKTLPACQALGHTVCTVHSRVPHQDTPCSSPGGF